MRGDAFFDAAKFAQAHYTATQFRALGGNRYAADGTLSLHGVTKPVTLTFTWASGAQPVLEGKATVNRLDFGIGSGDWADTRPDPERDRGQHEGGFATSASNARPFLQGYEPGLQAFRVERPIQFAPPLACVAQHRHALAVSALPAPGHRR
jgi:hypothetical protein